MSQTIIITLTTAGLNTGPFDLYAKDNLGVITGPFATNVPKASLLAGYTAVVADNIVSVIVDSDDVFCNASVEISIPTTTTTTTTSLPTTTTTTTEALEEFIIKANDITKFSFSTLITSVTLQIDFGPTTVTYLPGTYDWAGTPIVNDYGVTPYTGDIVIRASDLTGITRMEIVANDTNDYILPQTIGTAAVPSGFSAYIEGSELVKLDGLTRLFISNRVSISGATTSQFSSSLTYINLTYADVSGSVLNLPPNGTTIGLGNFNTVSGNVSQIPATYSTISISGLNNIGGDIGDISSIVSSFTVLGLNTITGDLAGIPGSFSTTGTSPLLVINVQGYNTITGDINELPVDNMTIVSITGEDGPLEGNTVSGNISSRTWNTGLLVLQITGRNTLSGNINAFTGCTSLQRLVITGESLSDPLTGTTITGNLSSLPTTTTLTEISFGGKNTVSGTLSSLSGYTNLQFLKLNGLVTAGEGNTVTGDIKDIPASTSFISLTGRNTITQYSVSKTWASTMYQFIHLPLDYTTTNRLSTVDIDRLIIDLDVPTWAYFSGTGGTIVSAGTRSVASDTAYNNLIAELGALTPPGSITIY